MLLPSGYTHVQEYFQDAMQFLCQYQWVYRYPVTRLLVDDVLNYIPQEWQAVFEDMSSEDLALLSSASVKEQWPESLVQYLKKCQNLQIQRKCDIQGWMLSPKFRKGMSLKKQHEVSQFSALVDEKCKELAIKRILDIGSGLGYLDLVLHMDMGYQVLGLDSKSSFVATAIQKKLSLCSNCNGICFLWYKVKNNVDQEIIDVLKEWLFGTRLLCTCNSTLEPENNVNETSDDACLIGLHPCGDLSAASANLFLQIPHLRLMILIPCCYHKMEVSPEREEEKVTSRNSPDNFSCFPLSETLASLLEKEFSGYKEYLGRPFLRLASQESNLRWQSWSELQHKQHSENLMTRATLELATFQLGLRLKKKNRRCVRKCMKDNFETFLQDVVERYDFLQPDNAVATADLVLRQTRHLWAESKMLCGLAEAHSALQAAMQACVETLVLVDRMVYMEEQQGGHLSFDVIKVMDERLSPRCHCLIVKKISESNKSS